MSEWISIKDRLPEDEMSFCTRYLVAIRTHGGILPKGYFESIEFASFVPARKPSVKPIDDDGNTAYWEFDGNEQNIPFEVTHWMPLPKLPEVKDER